MPISPAFGFDVVNVQVLALFDGRDHLADIHAILDHGVADFEIFERDLVTDWNIALKGHIDRRIGLHNPTSGFLAGLATLDDNDADAVFFFMHYEMNHYLLSLNLLNLAILYLQLI